MLEYLQVLEKYDYQGYLTLEINDSIYWDDPHRSIERTARYLRQVLPRFSPACSGHSASRNQMSASTLTR